MMTTDVVDTLNWDLPDPFTIDIEVSPDQIDNYGHVNNAVYVQWMDQVAWRDSEYRGLTKEDCDRLGQGMAVHKTQVEYIQACFSGETIRAATWIISNDNRLRCNRRYQFIRLSDGATVLRGLTNFVSIDLASGRPKRQPEEMQHAYRTYDSVQKALDKGT